VTDPNVESFIRDRIMELTDRQQRLERLLANGEIGRRVGRYQLRHLKTDYEWLAEQARAAGYKLLDGPARIL